MMNWNARWSLLFAMYLSGILSGISTAGEFSALTKEIKASLSRGEVVQLAQRPDETGSADKRFVTMAKLMTGSNAEIWEVIIDKENAEKFLDGVLESRIVSQAGNEMIIEQKTHVGGPKGSYRYTLKYRLTPEKQALFSFVKGEIKNVQGGWWIFEGPDPTRKLVVYSLHIDPGIFAPQFVVKRGMKKTIPETIISTELEILRRKKLTSEAPH